MPRATGEKFFWKVVFEDDAVADDADFIHV